jgi:hypothetical protein
VLFDWDLDRWHNFASDPEIPPIMQEAGHKGRTQVAEVGPAMTPTTAIHQPAKGLNDGTR